MNRFKSTIQLDMSVFEPERILDYADLFLSGNNKPTFNKTSKAEAAGDDPFDDMMAEAAEEEKPKEAAGGLEGLQPESFKSTQNQPDGPLQQKSGPYQGKSGNYQKSQSSGYQGNNNRNNYHAGGQHYKPHAAAQFDAFDDIDEDPEWNDFDPEKQTGGFFGREIPEEAKLR